MSTSYHSARFSKQIQTSVAQTIYLMFVQDSELMELRETIDALKTRNEEAQAVIHGALNNPDNSKGL